MTSSQIFTVITSINPPTSAVLGFSRAKSTTLIVVGDRKSPNDWQCDGVDFISFEAQSKSSTFSIVPKLPVDHYSRKMIGYLEAVHRGAETIIDTDDDNIPKTDWGFPSFRGVFDTTPRDLGFINVYERFSDKKIWPRGLPLEQIAQSQEFQSGVLQSESKVAVWQGLADGEPDVDAIYRLVFGDTTEFNGASPLILDEGTWSPWNSQNTAFSKQFFPLLYLPGFVSFRFTDILRSIVAQPIIWASGHRVGFCGPTVFQDRNDHSLMRDFNDEISMYKQVEQASQICLEATQPALSVSENLRKCYVALSETGIVENREIELLDAWLTDLNTQSKKRNS